MVIEFITDATLTASGFHAFYEQRTYEPQEEIPVIDSHQGIDSHLQDIYNI